MLKSRESLRLIMQLHAVAKESATSAALALALSKIAIARADGKGLGPAVDAVLRELLEHLAPAKAAE